METIITDKDVCEGIRIAIEQKYRSQNFNLNGIGLEISRLVSEGKLDGQVAGFLLETASILFGGDSVEFLDKLDRISHPWDEIGIVGQVASVLRAEEEDQIHERLLSLLVEIRLLVIKDKLAAQAVYL